jgi:hypothetical protein
MKCKNTDIDNIVSKAFEILKLIKADIKPEFSVTNLRDYLKEFNCPYYIGIVNYLAKNKILVKVGEKIAPNNTKCPIYKFGEELNINVLKMAILELRKKGKINHRKYKTREKKIEEKLSIKLYNKQPEIEEKIVDIITDSDENILSFNDKLTIIDKLRSNPELIRKLDIIK